LAEIPKESSFSRKSPKDRGPKIALAGTSQSGEYLCLDYIKGIYRDIKGAIRRGQINQRTEGKINSK